MGLKDRLSGAKRWLWSPMQVWMAEMGSDELVHAGAPAKVVVDVRGEDDGTVERIELVLQMTGWGNDERVTWPLAEIPATLGAHTLEVEIPTGLAPSCAKYAEYRFLTTLHRTKGTGSEAASVVDVVARPEDLYWPEGERTGTERADDAEITVDLAEPHVAEGATLSGTVFVAARRELGKDAVTLELGPTIDTLVQVAGKTQPQPRAKFSAATTVELAPSGPFAAGELLELPFTVEVPAGMPPTLHNGGQTSVVWQVRARRGDAVGWTLVGVLDPDASAGTRNQGSPSLLQFLGSLDSAR
jgi:hypothetical protein